MSVGRLITAVAASLAVAGSTAVVIGMANAESKPPARRPARGQPAAGNTPRPAFLPLTVAVPSTAATTSAAPVPRHPAAPRTTTVAVASVAAPSPSDASLPAKVVTPRPTRPPAPVTTHAAAPAHAVRAAHAAQPTRAATPARTASPTPAPAPAKPARSGHALPLHFRTHHARQVITVVASSHGSTTARLEAWRKARGGGWLRQGVGVTAYVGSDGLSRHASEYRSATPIGSFTLTHAFGHHRNPGTALPYRHTTPADWWISQSGPLYNTHQICSSNCPFTQGDPNEHLYYETPYYNYAVVIDYNTRNSPTGVRQGRGSAFFLHVTVGQPTAGCVAIPQRRLKHIMRWLRPKAHPRILIGVR